MAANDAVVIKLKLENAQLAKDLRKAEQGFSRLSAQAKKSSEGINKAFSDMGKDLQSTFSGSTVGQFASKLGPLGVGLAAAAGSAALLANEMVKVSKSVADMADVAESLSLTPQAFQQIQYAAGQAGADTEKLTTALQRLAVNLSKIAEGDGEEAVNALSKLGLSIEQILAASPDEQLKLIADGFQNLGTASERAYVGSTLFGRGYRALVPLLNEGKEGIESSIEAAERFGLIIGTENVKEMKKFDDGVETMKTGLNALKANALSPIVKFMNESLALVLDDSKTGWEKLAIAIQDAANAFIRFKTGGGLFAPELKEAPSVDAAERAKEAQARATEAGKVAYDAEEAAAKKLFEKLLANDKKFAEKRADEAEKISKASTAAADKAKALADKAKADAEAYNKSFASALASGQSDIWKAQIDLENVYSESNTQIALAVRLTEDLAKIQSSGFTKEHIAELEAQKIAEYEINSEIGQRLDIQEKLKKSNEELADNQKAYADQMQNLADSISAPIENALGSIITGAADAQEALKGMLEWLVQAIVRATILKAIFGGSFSSNFAGAITGQSVGPQSSAGLRMNVYNNTGGVITTRTRDNGDVDLIIGQLATAVSKGGNQFDKALRRTYGIGRQGV